MKIEQKLGLQRRTASIGADGVDVTYSDPFARERWKIPFEEVVREPFEFVQQPERTSTTRAVVLGLGIYFAFVTLTDPTAATIPGLLVAGACLGGVAVATLLERIPRRRLLQLSSGSPPLLLFADRPSREAVAAFRDALIDAASAWVGSSYPGSSGGGDLVDQLERLHGLQEKGALSQDEYERIKARLIGSAPYEGSGQYL